MHGIFFMLFFCKHIAYCTLGGVRQSADNKISRLLVGKANADGEYKRSAKLRKKCSLHKQPLGNLHKCTAGNKPKQLLSKKGGGAE